jgi:hypothetical protein
VQNISHSSFLILDEDAWEATVFPNVLGSTVASQQIILIKKNVSLSSLLSPLFFTHHHSSFSKKQLSLSSLILFSFLNLKEDADKRERERERRVYGRKKKNR